MALNRARFILVTFLPSRLTTLHFVEMQDWDSNGGVLKLVRLRYNRYDICQTLSVVVTCRKFPSYNLCGPQWTSEISISCAPVVSRLPFTAQSYCESTVPVGEINCWASCANVARARVHETTVSIWTSSRRCSETKISFFFHQLD
jgi:hypothetical protein